MSRFSRVTMVLVVIVATPAICWAEPPQAVGDQKVAPAVEAPPARFKIETGGELPFHVVDFFSGKHAKHCGCPSVMINNHDGKGLVIWTKGLNEASLRIAAAADKSWIDGGKKQAYVVVFDTTDEVIKNQLTKTHFTHVSTGRARHSSQQQFSRYEIDTAAAQHIFLVDGKGIKQLWSLKTGELTEKKEQEILKAAENHFTEK